MGLFLVGLAMRIIFVDVFFVFYQIDSVYVRYCKCALYINDIYYKQATTFDIFDYISAFIMLFHI